MLTQLKAKQIVPANGWYAKVEDENKRIKFMPIAVWVLTEDGQTDDVVGLACAYGDFLRIAESELDLEDTFLGYVHESEIDPKSLN